MEATKIMTLKLLIDSKNNKVVFAEASKEFVDFLFFFLSLPTGTVIKLINRTSSMEGSIGNLYKSFAEMEDSYLQNNFPKSTLLNPIPSIHTNRFHLLTATPGAGSSTAPGSSIGGNKAPNGFAKPGVKYLISDDLSVKSPSMISMIAMMNQCNVTDLKDLQEKVVKIGNSEGLQLLKASFYSTTVLTDVFLGNLENRKRKFG